jgi:hypothetical protein
MAARDFAAIEPLLDESLRSTESRRGLAQVADAMPIGTPRSIEVIGALTAQGPSDTRYSLTYEAEYETTWMLASVVLARKADRLLLEGLHITLTPQSQKAINAFSISGKGAMHLGFLTLTVLVPLFILVTLVVCYRTPVPRRKWLWYLFIAVGFVQFNLNWTTGALNILPVSFMLFGAGFGQATPHAPYVLAFALPLGAVVFLVARRKLAAVTNS